MSVQTEFYNFIQKHIATNTTASSEHGTTIPNAYDLERAITAGRLPDPSQAANEFFATEYKDWAETLKKTFCWAERRTSQLWYALKDARCEWLSKKLERPVATVVKGPEPAKSSISTKAIKVTSSGARKMDRAFSAISDVDIEDEDVISDDNLQDSQTNIYRMCDFCNKETAVHDHAGKLLQRLTGDRGFYCPFCVRHDFHTKKRKDVLALTFRGLIGYMYGICYFGRDPRLYLEQLKELVQQHVDVGQLNPLFIYDPETFCWFIDFAKVGDSKRKIPVNEVLRTANEIISAFNPYDYIRSFKSNLLANKYSKAIMEWHKHRRRPDGRAILSPTMKSCADNRREIRETNQHNHTTTKYKPIDISIYRDFLPQQMRHHTRR